MPITRKLMDANCPTSLVSAGTTVGVYQLPYARNQTVRFYAPGAVPIFVRFGDSTVTATVPVAGAFATTDGLPVAPGFPESFEIDPAITHIAFISTVASQPLYVSFSTGF
jgi:hypothetical protein